MGVGRALGGRREGAGRAQGGRGWGGHTYENPKEEDQPFSVRKGLPSIILYFPSSLFLHRQPARGRMRCLQEEDIKTASKWREVMSRWKQHQEKRTAPTSATEPRLERSPAKGIP